MSAGTYVLAPTFYGSTASGGDLTIDSTSNGSKGEIILAPSGGNVGIGITAPAYLLDVRNSSGVGQVHVSGGGGDNGGYLLALPSGFWMGGNAHFNGTNWVAKATSASVISQGAGVVEFFTDSGLTTGNTYSPTVRMKVDTTGNVGIGTVTPNAKLDVNGAIRSADVTNAGTTIDFSTGNYQYTSAACGAMTLNNLKSGASYMLAVQGAAGGTCSFTAYTGVATGGLTVKAGTMSLVQTATKHAIFTFVVMGSFVYVASADGF